MLEKVNPKVDFIALEHEMLDYWKKNDVFQKLVAANNGKEKWSFIDGPITANNPMGVHHAWGRTYKDVFQRYHAMKGYDLRYQNGFDCQGLWVEVEVEKEMNFKSKKDIEQYGIAAFVNKCKERVLRYSAVQTQQSVRLGYWMQWNDIEQLNWLADRLIENPEETVTIDGPEGPVTDTVENIVGRLGMPELGGSYYTFSHENNYMIWRALKTCHENGWLYRGADSMPWCPRCATGISQHEIVTDGYAEITHRSVTLKFPLREMPGEALLIWTTTPWTLTSNVAAAVGPELDYVKVRMKESGEILYLSKDATAILGSDHEVLQELKGSEMVGWTYDGPFDELPAQQNPGGWTEMKGVIENITVSASEAHRVIPWDEVGAEEGTGIVHIAPGAGAEDFSLGKEHGLPVIAPLNDEGYVVDGFGWLTQMSVSEVSQPIFDNLNEKGILFNVEEYSHRYPTCWRCKTELVFRLVDEWFISMDELRPLMMEITRQIRWIPGFGMDRELDWLKNMHDWMISKKRYWGLALPIWECDSCDHWTVVGDEVELKEKAVAGYEEFAGHTPHRPWIDSVKLGCEKCDSEMTRVPDVGNPWLDAGIVSFSTLRYRQDPDYWNKWYPADWISESFPGQFRNWFYSMLVMGAIIDKSPSFMNNFGYATLWAEDGRPMHKSWGNSIEFNEAADKMGVDVMRWIYCLQNPEQNLLFGYGPAKEIRRRLITLWNVYSFFVTYASLDDFYPAKVKVSDDDYTQLDKWITSRINQLMLVAEESYGSFRIERFMRKVDRFLDDLSNWYVRRNRRRFWKGEHDGDKNAAYLTLYNVLHDLIRLLAPIIPFVTERIYQNIVRNLHESAPESVHLCDYPVADPSKIDEALVSEVDAVIKIVEMGRHARNKANLKIRQPLAKLEYATPDKTFSAAVLQNKDQILEELNVKAVKEVSSTKELISYCLEPNLALLGQKYGKKVEHIRQLLDGAEYDEVVAAVRAEREVTFSDDGDTFALLPEEILIKEVPLDNKSVVSDLNLTVGISTELTEDLIQEGLVRDMIRQVQNMRKEADFNVEDRILVTYQMGEEIGSALEAYQAYFCQEVLAVDLKGGAVTGEFSKDVEVRGETVTFGISRVLSN